MNNGIFFPHNVALNPLSEESYDHHRVLIISLASGSVWIAECSREKKKGEQESSQCFFFLVQHWNYDKENLMTIT